MATTTKANGKRKQTTDNNGNPLYLQLVETREHGYYHLLARVVTQKYDDGSHGWVPYGCEDDYSDGPRWSGLRVSCQGDDRSRQRPGVGESGEVYGFGVEYRDVYSLDLRTVRRMHKTLETIDKGMTKIGEARGYVHSYGEYLGRVAEVLGCAGMAFERNARSREISGQRWDWTSVGDGVNRANHAIYLWVQAGKPQDDGERLQLQSGEAAS